MSDQVQHEEEFEEVGLGRYMAIAAVVAVVVAVAAFFAGRASGSTSGPATLAAAVSQAQAGKLPCGARARATPQPPGAGGRPNASFLVTAVCNRGGQGGFQRTGGTRPRGGFGFGGPGAVAGRVTSVAGSTLTVQGRQGTQKVKLGSSTTIRRYAAGSLSDLKPGDTVIVSGTGARRTVTVVPSAQSQ